MALNLTCILHEVEEAPQAASRVRKHNTAGAGNFISATTWLIATGRERQRIERNLQLGEKKKEI